MVDERNTTILSKVGKLVYKELLFWCKTFIFISFLVLILACLLLLYAIFFIAYHSEHGRYPNTLDDLIPKYITQIKPPPWGETGWLYKRHKKDFVLEVGYEFGAGTDYLYPFRFYSSSHGDWIVDM
ncbi:MAG: hypothetical protein ACYS67_16675 [Planctomycetota bacterium]|jgi:hypothetical protein